MAHSRVTYAQIRTRIFDEAASYINDAGMSWAEFWSTPVRLLREYGRACNRRAEKIERERERAAKRKSR